MLLPCLIGKARGVTSVQATQSAATRRRRRWLAPSLSGALEVRTLNPFPPLLGPRSLAAVRFDGLACGVPRLRAQVVH